MKRAGIMICVKDKDKEYGVFKGIANVELVCRK